ncbi:MAG: hypothetical protein R3F11_28325 [Verrucomicrobiales bacterium]
MGGREVLRWAEKAGRVVVLGDRAPGSLRQLASRSAAQPALCAARMRVSAKLPR